VVTGTVKVAVAVLLCWSAADIVYVPVVAVSAVTMATNVPDEVTDTGVGMVVIVVVAHVMVIVSDAVKPEPLIVVAKPEVGVSVIVGIVGKDAVTVKLPVAVAICTPLEDAVAEIV